MCSLRVFQVSQPKHPCTMPQMSASTSSYSGRVHQPHVCTQANHIHLHSYPSLHLSRSKTHSHIALALLSLVTSKAWLLRSNFFCMVFGSAPFLEFKPFLPHCSGGETLRSSPLPIESSSSARHTLY